MKQDTCPHKEDSHTKNKRIAKNTLFLYLRTFVTMVVALYTSRVTLEALGIDNYGIYNVVGGLVTMFTIVSSPVSSAISRFLTYGLGKGDIDHLRTIFSTSINVLICLGLILIMIGETIGLWFLNFKLNIPAESLTAANWVLQCSIFSLVLQIVNIPYSAAIISHEKMSVYAYMSILDVAMKLGLAFIILNVTRHVLIYYALGVLLISVIDRLIYGIYCIRRFSECRYIRVFDKIIFKEMTSFAGWSFFGNTAYMLNTQGVAMLMNIFWGVVVNAAKGISSQVETAVMSFVNSFTTAFSPQIIKSYAEGDRTYMFSVMERGTKFSFYLMLLFLIPLEFEAPLVLQLWLEEVPDHSVSFLRYSLVCTSIVLIGSPYLQGIIATGKIKKYQISVSAVGCLVFPITWIFYHFGYPVITFYWIFISIYLVVNFVRMWFVQNLLDYKIVVYLKNVFMPIIACSAMSLIIPSCIAVLIEDSILRLIYMILGCSLSTGICVYSIGINQSERARINCSLRNFLNNKLKKQCQTK